MRKKLGIFSRFTGWGKRLIHKKGLFSNVTLSLMSLPAVVHVFVFGYMTLPWLLVAFKRFRAADGL